MTPTFAEATVGKRRWTWLAYAYGLLVAAVLGYFLFGLVIQVSDSFGNLLAVQTPTLGELVRDQFSQRAYLRPLLWAQLKIVYELSGGHYFLWFRGIHVAQVLLLIVLFVHLVRPRTALDAALVPLSLAVLIGAHTFVPMVREAFPINGFLTMAVCCVAVATLALRERSRWYWDLLAIALFVGSVLTVESGVLVWVICVAAYALGARGLSRRAVLAMTACLVAYFVARTFVLDVGTPSLAERASGFGFRILEPSDLMARFEGRAWPFYAYNVVSSISTVLFAEPKGGVWRFVFELTTGTIHPWSAVSVVSSTAATVLVAWFLWTRRDRIRTWNFDHERSSGRALSRRPCRQRGDQLSLYEERHHEPGRRVPRARGERRLARVVSRHRDGAHRADARALRRPDLRMGLPCRRQSLQPALDGGRAACGVGVG